MKSFITVGVYLFSFLIASTVLASSEEVAVSKPTGMCTLDYNACGFSSLCGCPEEYHYDEAVGLCIINDIHHVTEAGLSSVDIKSSCSIQVPAAFACSVALNKLGYPKYCNCDLIGEYNPMLGQCVSMPGIN